MFLLAASIDSVSFKNFHWKYKKWKNRSETRSPKVPPRRIDLDNLWTIRMYRVVLLSKNCFLFLWDSVMISNIRSHFFRDIQFLASRLMVALLDVGEGTVYRARRRRIYLRPRLNVSWSLSRITYNFPCSWKISNVAFDRIVRSLLTFFFFPSRFRQICLPMLVYYTRCVSQTFHWVAKHFAR